MEWTIIETMKHFFMAFFILFSALSSSWAVAVFPSVPLSDFPTTEQVSTSYSVSTIAHSDCPSMDRTKSVQMLGEYSCPNCLDSCQCDHNSCHKMSSPLVGIMAYTLNTPILTEVSIAFVQSNVKNAPVFLNFRPPKIS